MKEEGQKLSDKHGQMLQKKVKENGGQAHLQIWKLESHGERVKVFMEA